MNNNSAHNGILLIDKQLGCTSFDVVRDVRRSLKTKTVGHTGTLDPLASGLLVILVGKYTRLSQWLMAHEKVYDANIILGTQTTTDDAEGEIIAEGDPSSLSREMLTVALSRFLGTHMQVPPGYSAISIAGERAYKKMRRGEDVTIPARPVTIDDIELLSWNNPIVELRIRCSAGTYIRAIARDLGRDLGIPAHLGGLRRLSSGAFQVKDAHSQEWLKHTPIEESATHLIFGREAFLSFNIIELTEQQKVKLQTGQRITSGILIADTPVAIAFFKDEPIALVRIENNFLQPIRGF